MQAVVVVTTVGDEEQAISDRPRARRPSSRRMRQHHPRRALGLSVEGEDLSRRRVPAGDQESRERVRRRRRSRSVSCTATSCRRSSPSRSTAPKRGSCSGSGTVSTRPPSSPTRRTTCTRSSSTRAATSRLGRRRAAAPACCAERTPRSATLGRSPAAHRQWRTPLRWRRGPVAGRPRGRRDPRSPPTRAPSSR